MTKLATEDQGHTLETLHYRSTDILMQELKQANFHVSARDLDRLFVAQFTSIESGTLKPFVALDTPILLGILSD